MENLIKPINVAGKWRTAMLPSTITPQDIESVLGFAPNIADDPDKVTHSWGFTVNGHECGIWDYKGSRWSVYDPDKLLPQLFETEKHK